MSFDDVADRSHADVSAPSRSAALTPDAAAVRWDRAARARKGREVARVVVIREPMSLPPEWEQEWLTTIGALR